MEHLPRKVPTAQFDIVDLVFDALWQAVLDVIASVFDMLADLIDSIPVVEVLAPIFRNVADAIRG